MSEIVLETKNLGIAFGGLKAVENLNIRIEEKRPERSGKNDGLQYADGRL